MLGFFIDYSIVLDSDDEMLVIGSCFIKQFVDVRFAISDMDNTCIINSLLVINDLPALTQKEQPKPQEPSYRKFGLDEVWVKSYYS